MRIAVIGAGPAALMAAEAARARGAEVHVFEQRRSAGRKLLVAGKGGLNLTHSEPLERLLDRYGEARGRLEPHLRAFPPAAVRAFAGGLGQETWVGSGGRVFPRDAKAAPLLRGWIARLRSAGVRFHMRRSWNGWTADGRLTFTCPEGGVENFASGATVLALGGASWPETGSDGRWVATLRGAGVEVAPLVPANAGWIADLPAGFTERFQGAALKSVAITVEGGRERGDVIVTRDGIEGNPVYRLGPALRGALEAGPTIAELDLTPDLELAAVESRLARGAGKGRSRATRLRSLRLSDAARALVLATRGTDTARTVKALPLRVRAFRPVEEAISSAGGVRWSELDERLMLIRKPGVFVAGEMIDWEAPTGGYLLQACFATGRAAGDAAAAWGAAHGR